MEDSGISPFTISIPQEDLDDLNQRLARIRWPDKETVDDLSQGVPLSAIRSLCEYWQKSYKWRQCEAYLNSYLNYKINITIDGSDCNVHFISIKSKEKVAMPMLLTHGWPGSILEFRHVIESFTDPVEHGGTEDDAFDLVIPSLPGFGFSSKPTEAGWSVSRVAKAWGILMDRLYKGKGFVAQGGDWGADIVAEMAHQRIKGLMGVHMNSTFFDPDVEIARTKAEGSDITSGETHSKELWDAFLREEYGYFKQQNTRPQTVGYGLADSPSGQAAWIYEKYRSWSQSISPDGMIPFSEDEMLDHISIYWLTNSAASSARQYWENEDTTALETDVPVGVSVFPGDQTYAPRKWGERYYKNIIHWKDVEKGGHFAAWEVPKVFVREVRDCFAKIRRLED